MPPDLVVGAQAEMAHGPQPEMAPQVQEVHTYQAKDGTVYTGTAQEILTLCPAFNSLPPEIGKVMLNTYLLGKQELAKQAEAAKVQARDTKPEAPKKVAAAKKETAAEETPSEIIETPPGEPIVTVLPPQPVEAPVVERPQVVTQPQHEQPKAPALLEPRESTPLVEERLVLAEALRPDRVPSPLELPEPVSAEAWRELAEPEDLSAEIHTLLDELRDIPEPVEDIAAEMLPITDDAPVLVEPELASEAPIEQSERSDQAIIRAFVDTLLPPETNETTETEEKPSPPLIFQEVAARIERIEPEAQEEAVQVMSKIALAVQAITDPKRSVERRQQAEQTLEELVVQLFELIGLEDADEAAVKRFVVALRQLDFAKFAGQTMQESWDEGTREFKKGPWNMLNPFAASIVLTLYALAAGNLALRQQQTPLPA